MNQTKVESMKKMKWAAAVQALLWPSRPSVAVGSKLVRRKGWWRDWLWKKSEGKEEEEFVVAKGG